MLYLCNLKNFSYGLWLINLVFKLISKRLAVMLASFYVAY